MSIANRTRRKRVPSDCGEAAQVGQSCENHPIIARFFDAAHDMIACKFCQISCPASSILTAISHAKVFHPDLYVEMANKFDVSNELQTLMPNGSSKPICELSTSEQPDQEEIELTDPHEAIADSYSIVAQFFDALFDGNLDTGLNVCQICGEQFSASEPSKAINHLKLKHSNEYGNEATVSSSNNQSAGNNNPSGTTKTLSKFEQQKLKQLIKNLDQGVWRRQKIRGTSACARFFDALIETASGADTRVIICKFCMKTYRGTGRRKARLHMKQFHPDKFFDPKEIGFAKFSSKRGSNHSERTAEEDVRRLRSSAILYDNAANVIDCWEDEGDGDDEADEDEAGESDNFCVNCVAEFPKIFKKLDQLDNRIDSVITLMREAVQQKERELSSEEEDEDAQSLSDD